MTTAAATQFEIGDHVRAVQAGGDAHRLMGWTPRHDNVLVWPLAEIDRSAGGLIITEVSRERPQLGVVLAIGHGLVMHVSHFAPVHVKVGDLVTFGKYAGLVYELDGLALLIIRDVEIMASKAFGDYELIGHTVPKGITEIRTYHLAGQLCEHCPKPVSTFLEEERARLLREREHDAVAHAEGEGLPPVDEPVSQ